VVAFGSLRRVVSIKLDTSDQGGLTGFLEMGGLVGKPSSTAKFKALWTTDGIFGIRFFLFNILVTIDFSGELWESRMGFIVLEIQNLVRISIGIMLDSKRMLWIGVVRKAPRADLMAEW